MPERNIAELDAAANSFREWWSAAKAIGKKAQEWVSKHLWNREHQSDNSSQKPPTATPSPDQTGQPTGRDPKSDEVRGEKPPFSDTPHRKDEAERQQEPLSIQPLNEWDDKELMKKCSLLTPLYDQYQTGDSVPLIQSTQKPPTATLSKDQTEQPTVQDPKSLPSDRLLATLNEKVDTLQKDLTELRKEIHEYGDLMKAADKDRKPREHSSAHPVGRKDTLKREAPTTPAEAREAFHQLRKQSEEIGGETPKEEKRLEAEFRRLQEHEQKYFHQARRVVNDVSQLQKDERFHPERLANDEEKLRRDRLLLRGNEQTVRHDSQSLQRDAARFGKEHPEMRTETKILAKEADRETSHLPSISSDSSLRHGSHLFSHAQRTMSSLREKARGDHSPTLPIVTQAGRHLHIFESSRKELLALHKKYEEDLLRAQRDRAFHPEEWKRLRDDRRRLAQDRAAIQKDEQILGREAHTIGHLAHEIGRQDPSLRKAAQNLDHQVKEETRDAHRFIPLRDPRERGRDR